MKRYHCLSRSKKITDTNNQNRADDRRTNQGEEYSKKKKKIFTTEEKRGFYHEVWPLFKSIKEYCRLMNTKKIIL